MPKTFKTCHLADEQYDRCELCPLCGLIPKEQREKGKRQKYCCLGIYEDEKDEHGRPVLDENGMQKTFFPRLSSKGIRVSAKTVKEGGHHWDKPCDDTWDSWMTIPGHTFGIPPEVYLTYRLPFEQEQMLKNMPMLPLRVRTKKK